MNRSQVSINPIEGCEKDSSNHHKKTNSNRDCAMEQYSEENEKTSSTTTQSHTKNGNVFDYAAFSVFFKDKSHQSKNSIDTSQGRSHQKKISTESNSNKDTTQKSSSFKEQALDELYENTTILSGADSKSHTKKKSYESNKTLDDHFEVSTYCPDSSFAKSHTKKKSNEKNSMTSSMRMSHSKEPSNDADIADNLTRSVVNTEADDQEKVSEQSTIKEKSFLHKPPKNNNLDEKLIEKIKSKVNHKSHSSNQLLVSTTETSRNNNNSIFKNLKADEKAEKVEKVEKVEKTEKAEKSEKLLIQKEDKTDKIIADDNKRSRESSFYASSPIIYNFKNTEIYADGSEALGNNNPSLKSALNPNQKQEVARIEAAHQNLQVTSLPQIQVLAPTQKKKPENDEENNLLMKDILSSDLAPYIVEPNTPFSTPRLESLLSVPNTLNPSNSYGNANNSFIIDDANGNPLQDGLIWRQTPTKRGEATQRSNKPNLSVLSTESTIDSDNFTLNTNEHNNNSFTTHFSGHSTSFNNSGKIDFNSPSRVENNRFEVALDPKANNLNVNQQQYFMFAGKTSFNNNNIAAQKLQQLIPISSSRVPMNLNQSCINHFGGNSFSDHSSSFSFNNDDFSALSSNFSTPQGRQQQNFINHNQSFSVLPTTANKNPFFMVPPQNFSVNPNSMSSSDLNMMQINNMNNMNNLNNMMNGNNNQNLSLGMMSSRMSENYNFNQTPTSSSANSNNKLSNSNSTNQMNIKSSTRLRKKTLENDDTSSAYDIDVTRVDDKRTTLMIKNIPNKYDRTLILQTIDKNHKGKYDFFYLPIDFRNRCNVGYAFINFIESKFIKSFYDEFNGKRWEKFNSEKICLLKYARIQGRAALIQHFQFSSVMNQQDKKLKPLILPNQGLSNIEQLVKQQKANLENDS